MDSMVKWIGGATAAVLFALGGASLASDWLGAGEEPVESLETAIPVDEGRLSLAEKPAPKPAAAKKDERFVIKRILPIEGAIKYGEWHWDDADVPDGPIVMTVDLDARVLSVFKGGYEIGAAAVLLGTDEYPTPLGTFPILAKQRHNVSEKYNNAPMPWSMFLTRDGVAIHGGSTIQNGYASHGCIAAPDDFVSKVFAVAGKGDKVIITRGETMTMGDSIV